MFLGGRVLLAARQFIGRRHKLRAQASRICTEARSAMIGAETVGGARAAEISASLTKEFDQI